MSEFSRSMTAQAAALVIVNAARRTDVLRGQMGFDGMVMTDALNMGAITSQYSSADAAVKALQAGLDMLLMPEDFESAFQGVLQAVSDGRLTEERIDQSVERILRIKLSM